MLFFLHLEYYFSCLIFLFIQKRQLDYAIKSIYYNGSLCKEKYHTCTGWREAAGILAPTMAR